MPEPENPEWVALWVAEQVYADNHERALWIRWVAGGPGWHTTSSPLARPTGGSGYTFAAWVEWETAAHVLGHIRKPYDSQWAALCRLVTPIREALDAERAAS